MEKNKIDKNAINSDKSDSNSVQIALRREIGLLEAVSVILGSIIGSGIFVSPKGVLTNVGSIGMSLCVWAFCGIMAINGALCYTELGTTFPKAGGDYHYLKEAYGPIFAFLSIWATSVIMTPCAIAIFSLTFSKYAIQPFFSPGCEIPDSSVKLLAAGAICFLTFINCYDFKKTTKLQNIFMVSKLTALIVVIVVGFYFLFSDSEKFERFHYENAFRDSKTSIGNIFVAFYSGIFAFAGSNNLNVIIEEVKNPNRNLPLSIIISLPIVIIVYILTNFAYFGVLSTKQILESDAVAVTFGNQTFGVYLASLMSIFVAISTFGTLSINILQSSRLILAGARNGHFPCMLSLINISTLTPVPSLISMCLLALCYLQTSNIYILIDYLTFVGSAFSMGVCSALIYLRITRPNIKRPIKIPLIIPILYFFVCLSLVIFPALGKPYYQTAIGILMTLSGLPVYYIFIYREYKPRFIEKFIESTTIIVQKIFNSVKEDEQLEDEFNDDKSK